jgi:hypothetical protein
MDHLQMTAPCGLDCFNCTFNPVQEDEKVMKQVELWSEEYNLPTDVMLCQGCRNHDGQIPLQKHLFGDAHRPAAYQCSKTKNVVFCVECEAFPCDYLHPCTDRAQTLPHNIKVFNLCLINRMGFEQWATSKAAEVRDTYFSKPWSLAK